MPLLEIILPPHACLLPGEVAALLREAETRIDEYFRNHTGGAGGFVTSQFATVYHALRAIVEGNLAPGNVFCEWGSSFGVVACLAAMLEFDVSRRILTSCAQYRGSRRRPRDVIEVDLAARRTVGVSLEGESSCRRAQ